jgi:hypothetical protein
MTGERHISMFRYFHVADVVTFCNAISKTIRIPKL